MNDENRDAQVTTFSLRVPVTNSMMKHTQIKRGCNPGPANAVLNTAVTGLPARNDAYYNRTRGTVAMEVFMD